MQTVNILLYLAILACVAGIIRRIKNGDYS